MRALRHRGDGGKLIVMRLNDLEEYVTDLITWQQRVDSLLHEPPKDQLQDCSSNIQGQESSSTQRPHWEPKTKADIRPHVIGNFFHFSISIASVLDLCHKNSNEFLR